MKNDEAILLILQQISDRLGNIERRQENDKKEMLERLSESKKKMLERFSSFEASSNLHFTGIHNTLDHERVRIDEIHKERKNVHMKFSKGLVGMNAAFAGIIAFCVSFFSK